MQTMMRGYRYIVCFACVFALLQNGILAQTLQDAESVAVSSRTAPLGFDDPKWAVGMEWRYAVEMSSFGGQPFEMKGNVTMRVNATTNVKVGKNTYATLKFALWGGGKMKGSFGGFPVTGSWFMQGRTHTLANVTANVQTETYINITTTGTPSIKATNYVIQNWTPPEDPYDFPMSIGNKWKYVGTTETYNWTYAQGLGYIAQPSKQVANITQNFSVTKDEYRTVPAGTFYTYLVESSSLLLQPVIGAGKEYYSDAAGNAVSIIMIDNQSNPTGYYNLTFTNYPPPSGKYGNIIGKVTDSKGALPGVKLSLSTGGKSVAILTSGATGNYNFSNLLPTSYDLLANKSTYEDNRTGIQLAAGAIVQKDIFMKKPEGVLEVKVKDKGGKGLDSVTISIKGPVDINGNTDAMGKLTKTVPKGSYVVTASKTGYKNATSSTTVTSGGTAYANLTLEPNQGKLKGKVIDLKNGLGIVNAIITISQSGSAVANATSSANGDYQVDLQPGTYQVQVTAAGYVSANDNFTIFPGQTVSKDFKLSPREKKEPEKPAEGFPIWIALIPIVIIVVILLLFFMFKKKPKSDSVRKKK